MICISKTKIWMPQPLYRPRILCTTLRQPENLANGHKHNFERTAEDARAHTNHLGRWFKAFSIRDFFPFFTCAGCAGVLLELSI